MRAMQLTRLDGPDGVELVHLPDPAPTDGRVQIDVHAAGVAFPDLLQSRGQYQSRRPLPMVLGGEVSGVVREAPAGSRLVPGQPVLALPLEGGWQETVSVDPFLTFPLPPGVDLTVAGGLPVNHFSVHFALVRRARAQPGETMLVHGAAGGVGTAAIDLGKALGLRVLAVVSDARKAAVAHAAGADEVLAADGFLAAAREATDGRGVDIVLDPVGGDRFTDSLRSLAPEGRVLVLGFTAGSIPTVKVNRLLLSNTSVLGVGWGEFLRHEPGLFAKQWADLEPLLASGKLHGSPTTALPLGQAREALRQLDERRALGKLVLTVR
jgi:NADPH2:quinone reductase